VSHARADAAVVTAIAPFIAPVLAILFARVDLGKKIIAESKLNVTSADDLDDAAQKVVAAVKKAA
jgi:succinyl-CoA synthetase beta subunit